MIRQYLGPMLGCALFCLAALGAQAKTDKPNILVIWGDDIGWSNLSVYHRGMLGSRTPNIDRIANEGAMFTDYYGEQSCTAGRSAFITGQHPLRTGLLKVGLPGADIGLRPEDPTIAGLLKPHGYATGHFGKNHLGDKDEFLPSNHGFNATRMHVWTRLAPKWQGSSGYGLYADGMMEHDHQVGQLLDRLDDLGISDNTIVIHSTDNGSQTNTYPDGGSEPFRGEKGSTWEGGFRVPALIRWPGVVRPGTVINDIVSHQDWLPTLLAAAGAAAQRPGQ